MFSSLSCYVWLYLVEIYRISYCDILIQEGIRIAMQPPLNSTDFLICHLLPTDTFSLNLFWK